MLMASQSNCIVHSTAVCTALCSLCMFLRLACIVWNVCYHHARLRETTHSPGATVLCPWTIFVCSTAALTDPGLCMAATNKLGTAASLLYCSACEARECSPVHLVRSKNHESKRPNEPATAQSSDQQLGLSVDHTLAVPSRVFIHWGRLRN